jgi:hypothetical protein
MLPQMVAPADQRAALAAVLKTLSPATLTLPESLLALFPPRPPGLPRTQESFPSATGLTFDPIAAAQSAADLTLALLLNPQRANRLVEYHARDSAEPSLDDVIHATFASTHVASSDSGLALEIRHAVDDRILLALMALGANQAASPQTQAIVRAALSARLVALRGSAVSGEEGAFNQLEASRIDAFLADPSKFIPAKPIPAPPGMPIGDDED